jgi:antirestriction protein ArdC
MPAIDIYQQVTDSIVAILENGTRPWVKPWSGNGGAAPMPVNLALPMRANGQNYRGINILLLWSQAAAKGYASNYWLTYKQAGADGGNVKRGEKGTHIVFFSPIVRQDDDGTERKTFILRGYTVFNADQCENLPAKYYTTPVCKPVAAPQPADKHARIASAESLIANTGAVIRHGGDRAFYMPALDAIQMPDFNSFVRNTAYYATCIHELAHWTGHASRLNRQFGARFGDDAYATEELVAELASAFTCASIGMGAEEMPQHASYIASWLRRLKNDKKYIFTAASAAQKAADLLIGKQANSEEETE